MQIELMIPGIPVAKGSYHIQRRGKKAWLLPGSSGAHHRRLEDWEHRVLTYATATMRANGLESPLEGAVAARLVFYMPRPKSAAKRLHCAVKPDIDKLCRGCLDPLSGVVIRDDARIVSLSAAKVYADADNPPGVLIDVWTV